MPIPATVKHADLMTALQPLMDLLGVTNEDVYLSPPLTIRSSEDFPALISFGMVPGEPTGERRDAVPAANGELVEYVTVGVI